jgi:putative ABC transport system permease protein
MRPGLAGLSGMQLTYSGGNNKGAGASATPNNPYPCPPGYCLANPVIQQVNALPSGTSAPNTVITEHAISKLGLQSQTSVDGWMIIGPHDVTAAQITSARLAAAQLGMSIETKNSAPTSSEVIGWATVFGLVLALGILAMSVGLIRSETASDLRTLTATGASSFTRRTLTGVTAGGLGFLGALLGVFAGYVGMIGWIRGSSLNGGVSALGNVPVNALLVLLIGMPAAATAVGWLLSGREPASVAHQPVE